MVREHDVIYLPPGVEHSINNTGLVDLVFIVVTSPVTDDGAPSLRLPSPVECRLLRLPARGGEGRGEGSNKRRSKRLPLTLTLSP